jgi:hypothetical protein
MVSVGSLPVEGTGVFDFESQSGVMHLLASLRRSEITSSQKSEVRDLVFLYTNGGRDEVVRRQLEQKIATYQIVPLPSTKKPEPNTQVAQLPPPTIGKYRNAPHFSVREVPAQPAAPVKVVETQAQPTVPEPVVAPEPMPTPVPVPVKVSVAPAPAAPMPVPATEESLSESALSDTQDIDQYLVRIREIKASVNEKIGNPVNLVDINNEVGREYMGALLDAMKKLNSGSSAGSAMKRLESAYTAVLTTIESYESHGGKVASVSPTPSAPAPVVPVDTYVPPIPQPVFVESPVSVPKADPVPVASFALDQQRVPEPSVVSDVREPIPVAVPVTQTYAEPTPVMEPVVAKPPVVLKVQSNDLRPIETLGDQTPISSQPAVKFASLAEVKKPHTLEDLESASAQKAEQLAAEDPLINEEIEEGLDQLLSEWSIFKKSGMFGTGPKGKNHPLFKKMSPLHIPLILAGRFEGATQEIKQSVTDYMNGWRYEQGIIYQQGETFEHYLRRVIRHIIDLQK